jgi:hypothetical protein
MKIFGRVQAEPLILYFHFLLFSIFFFFWPEFVKNLYSEVSILLGIKKLPAYKKAVEQASWAEISELGKFSTSKQ